MSVAVLGRHLDLCVPPYALSQRVALDLRACVCKQGPGCLSRPLGAQRDLRIAGCGRVWQSVSVGGVDGGVSLSALWPLPPWPGHAAGYGWVPAGTRSGSCDYVYNFSCIFKMGRCSPVAGS